MIAKSRYLVPTALCLVLSMLAGATHLIIFVAGAAVALVCALYAMWQEFKPRNKYDLSLLKDLEDREELRHLDPQVGVFEFDDYLCPYCRTRYSMEYRNCPKCGRTRSS